MAYIEPNVYAQMYDIYKKKTAENAMKKWEEYGVNISSDLAKDVKNFVPVKKYVYLYNILVMSLILNHSD